MIPVTNIGKPSSYHESTPLAVMVHKGGQSKVHDVCIVCTAVCQTTPVRLMRYQTMKRSSLYISLAVNELWFSQGIS